MRLLCILFGCHESEEGPCCRRCGVFAYHVNFRARGWLSWAVELRERLVTRWRGKRCYQCGKRMKGEGWGNGFCSKECQDQFLPF